MTRRTTIVLVLCILAAGSTAVAPGVWSGIVCINEVCWGGNSAKPTAEWIELVNTTDSPLDLEGWRLLSSDGSPDIFLSGTIAPRSAASPQPGYFLLERDGDDAVPEIPADFIYTGALSDRGESLYLYDAHGHLVDSANAFHAAPSERRWPAGTNGYGIPPHRSMERIDFRRVDAADGWSTCPLAHDDEAADGLSGTPKRENRTFNVLPSASLKVKPDFPQPGKPAVFDGSGSTDQNDGIALYEWDFGDGETAVMSTATTTHTYAAAGRYQVTLALRDWKGGMGIASLWIDVMESHPPIADFSVRSLSGRRTLLTLDPLRFQDESSDEEGELVSWDWDFGDGTTECGRHVEHVYGRPGVYSVSLAVQDRHEEHAVQTQSIVIANRPPEAHFTVDDASLSQGDAIMLDASLSSDPDGTIASYSWDFDADGSVDQETRSPTVEHRLDRGGDVSVALVVVDDQGDRSLPATVTMAVNCLPVAQFTASSFTARELELVRFSDCSYDPDGAITGWSWDFGDESSSSAASPEHAFTGNGTFNVSLTVVDGRGATGTTTAEIAVENLPPQAVCAVDVAGRDTGSMFSFDAAASSDPSPGGRLVGYEWDYDGDGVFDESTPSPSVRHAYTSDGTYTIRVRVTDDDGAATTSDGVRVTVRNRNPIVGVPVWGPTAVTDAEAVRFSSTASDPDGTVVRWDWTFGDGTSSSDSSPSHRFPDDGPFLVSVTVVDDDGAKSEPASAAIEIANAPPVSSFTQAPSSECARGVAFDASDSHDPSPTGSVVHVAWDFGDGTTCPGSAPGCGTGDRIRPVHCYPTPGSYAVTLVVIDEEGAIARFTREVEVSE